MFIDAYMETSNPFINGFTSGGFGTFDNAAPLDKIKPEHYLPALDWAMEQTIKKIEGIKAQLPTFSNTIEALEISNEHISIIKDIYDNLFNAESIEELTKLSEEINTKLSVFYDNILLDAELFAKVKTVNDQKDADSTLDDEEKRLIEETYTSFIRNGALLSEEDKNKLRKINEHLAVLEPKFAENVRNHTNGYELVIEDVNELEGLPANAIQTAHEEAESKGYTGKWLITLQIPSYLPVMQYAKKRSLREKLAKEFATRAVDGEFSNIENIKNIVRLRLERANLLGFKTHAEFILSKRMAKDEKTVNNFLEDLKKGYHTRAKEEIEELKEYAKNLDGNTDFQGWDLSYYTEKLKEERYQINDEQLRPYFMLENVIEGAFTCAKKLYGLDFIMRDDLPGYHPDVKIYEVRDEAGKYIGLFYTDFFPRATKRGGAWMTIFRNQGLYHGEVSKPHISIVCNFTKPTSSTPSLLTYDEVTTLFHEFGHALHGMLSDVKYSSLAGINVRWDFVELPSQMMENWVREKEGLDVFAKHYKTNEPIPAEMVEKIKQSENFMIASFGLRQVRLSLTDLLWHGRTNAEIADIIEEENKVLEETDLLPKIPGAAIAPSFTHIFAGGYSAGYYSYKWAEVLAADAFEYFKEKGIFNKEVADKFRNNILSKGNTKEPMELYKAFRGKEPDPKALLRSEGLA